MTTARVTLMHSLPMKQWPHAVPVTTIGTLLPSFTVSSTAARSNLTVKVPLASTEVGAAGSTGTPFTRTELMSMPAPVHGNVGVRYPVTHRPCAWRLRVLGEKSNAIAENEATVWHDLPS